MKVVQYLKNVLMDLFLGLVKIYRYGSLKLGILQLTDGQYGIFDYKEMRCSSTIHSPELLERCEQFDDFRDDDVIVLTYPKAGTHFLGDVINSIYLEKGLYTKEKDHVMSMAPFEIGPPGMSAQFVQNILKKEKSPRVIGAHLPWNLMPPKVKSHQVKVIHCLRNPKDVACSTYPFLKRMGVLTEDTTWEQFLDYFISDKIIYGDFFEFIRQWYPNRKSPNNLYVYYEDMIEDLDRETRRIAEFLDMELTDEQVARIVEANTFSNLKKKVGNTVIHRQGKSGTWTDKFTLTQNEAVDRWIERGMVGLDHIKFKYG